MDPSATTPGAGYDPRLRSSVASWLGALFCLVLLLMLVGGYVRLTQSGLSLPGWPFVEGRVLPPVTDQGWAEMWDLYRQDMAVLQAKREAGVVGLGAMGHQPTDMADFKRIFLIEWSHRFLAALVGIVGLACMTVLLRDRALRRLAGTPIVAIVSLIVVQSIIGGILVLTHTATHWLFVHLGIATAILGSILWTLMLMLRGRRDELDQDVRQRRHWARRWVLVALVAVFVQLLFGALVAGSRHNGFSTSWPDMNGELVPALWHAGQGVAWNLLDNPHLHQWVHRWFAWIAVFAVAIYTAVSLRADLGNRGRIATRFAFSAMTLQVVLGILNVLHGAALFIAMSHLLVALLVVAGLVIAAFDLRYEDPALEDLGEGTGERVPRSIGGAA